MNNYNKSGEFVESNRKAWNQAALHHHDATWEKLVSNFSNPNYTYFPDWEKEILISLGINGKRIAQPCCNNGRELLSLLRLGAKQCVGFELSDEFVKMGNALSNHCKTPVEFVQCNALDIPTQYHSQFDVVFISVGTLCWFNNMDFFFNSCNKLLSPKGEFWIIDTHPILDMFVPGGSATQIATSYFRTEPFVDTEGLDYFTGKKYESAPTISFPYRLSDIFQALIKADLAIKDFREFDREISLGFPQFNNPDCPKPPLSFFIHAKH
ncbi:MAG: class I SAM-dependent methyltransferase [Oligoflexia bacterium]|nr:class I SAM-dependent methyltransferase [Oligoflexia bacterium]MBF0363991.1 class I SAM-dependent methyltransferase [Oligoflexia bacterium]